MSPRSQYTYADETSQNYKSALNFLETVCN